MTIPDGLGEALRAAMAVPTDTMITLDLPLLLTKLAQVPARETIAHTAEPAPPNPRRRVDPAASTDNQPAP